MGVKLSNFTLFAKVSTDWWRRGDAFLLVFKNAKLLNSKADSYISSNYSDWFWFGKSLSIGRASPVHSLSDPYGPLWENNPYTVVKRADCPKALNNTCSFLVALLYTGVEEGNEGQVSF